MLSYKNHPSLEAKKTLLIDRTVNRLTKQQSFKHQFDYLISILMLYIWQIYKHFLRLLQDSLLQTQIIIQNNEQLICQVLKTTSTHPQKVVDHLISCIFYKKLSCCYLNKTTFSVKKLSSILGLKAPCLLIYLSEINMKPQSTEEYFVV